MAVEIYKLGSISGNKSSWKSTDEGISWTETTFSCPVYSTKYGRFLRIDDSIIIFFAGESKLTSGATALNNKVYKSIDNGLTYTAVTNLPELMGALTSVLYKDGTIYVFGGGSNSGAISSIYTSSDLGTTWTKLADFPLYYHIGSTALYFNSKFWKFGGGSGLSDIPSNYTYSSLDGITWTRLADMPTTRYKHSAVIFNNEIVLIGGMTSGTVTNGTVISSPDGVTWTTRTPSPNLTAANMSLDSGYQAFVIGDTLYYISGYNASGVYGKVNIYKTTDLVTWSSFESAQTVEANVVYLVSPQTVSTLNISSSINSISSVQATVELIQTISLTVNIDSISNLNIQIDSTPVDAMILTASLISASSVNIDITLLPAITPLYLSCLIYGQSTANISISISSNFVIRGNVMINGVAQLNVKVYAVSETSNLTYVGQSDSQGDYEINVVGSGYYHIFSLFKDQNDNMYSSLGQPYVNVLEVQP